MNTLQNININPNHLTMIIEILKKNISNDILVWVFGSRVNSSFKKFSDIDLLLQHKNNILIPLKKLASIKADFVESDLPIHVDIIDYNSISGVFKENVNTTKVLLPLN
jgi:predicted nucleotidyltransferase